MSATIDTRLRDLLRSRDRDLLQEWLDRLTQSTAGRRHLISETELQAQAAEFVKGFIVAIESGNADVSSPPWYPVREQLERLSASRAQKGFTPSETATFVFSLKAALFHLLRQAVTDPVEFAELTWTVTTTLDALGLHTMEAHQTSREEVILRQQQEMLELSTPVITLWEGVLALPVIGTLDSARTQVVMENLLQRIVDTGSVIAILDITGVPTVDTLVAQHLLKTVAAARLMGADCIISGIRPQIAQTIVHLGVDLDAVTTKATLADAFGLALRRLNKTVISLAPAPVAADTNANAGSGARPVLR